MNRNTKLGASRIVACAVFFSITLMALSIGADIVFHFVSASAYTQAPEDDYSSQYLYSTLTEAEKEFYDSVDVACKTVLSSTTDYLSTVDISGERFTYIDIIPYNGPSLKFHEAMGFKEVGQQVIRGGEIKVSLEVRQV